MWIESVPELLQAWTGPPSKPAAAREELMRERRRPLGQDSVAVGIEIFSEEARPLLRAACSKVTMKTILHSGLGAGP